jgi:4a-hydroxytetrahydrobiopterin dehydratase
MSDPITPKQFHEADGTEDWRVVSEGATAFFPCASLMEGAKLVNAISEIAGVDDHPRSIDIRSDGVTVRLLTKTAEHYGMSTRDVELARRISVAARNLGMTADPSAVQSLLVIPGAPDIKAVMPFWRAALGYEPRPDSPEEDLIDPHDRDAAFWFEQMEQPRGDGGGAVHLAVWVPYEQAEARIAAALAAGGHMVRDDFAPAWWTLADEAGNEIDIATVEHRDEPPPTTE